MARIDNVKYKQLSASAQIKATAGAFHGYIVNSHSGGTLKFWDSDAASGAVLIDTITLPSGPTSLVLNNGIDCPNGLYVTIGGTASVTILFT